MSDPAAGLPVGAAGVLEECRPLVDGFAAAGARLFLVGGIVRDLYGGAPLDDLDLDFTTDATPAAVKAIVGPIAEAVWTQGERFGTIAAKVAGRLVEITTHRAEAYDPESRKPAVVFADDVLVDLSRRDFTINALAIELTSATPRLIDPFDGVGDLRARRLRTPLAPSESFSDDPLRMLRAARFTARLGAVADAEVVAAMTTMADRLSVVSAERIRDELAKLLATADPAAGLDLLLVTGLARGFLPELGTGSVAVVTATPPDPILRLAAVLVGHGEAVARQRMRALRQPRHDVGRVAALVGLVEAAADRTEWPDAAIRRLAHRAGPDLGAVVDLLAATTTGPDHAGVLRRRIAELSTGEDLSDFHPPLDGAAVMDLLGVPPGRDVGLALDHLLELRLETGPLEPDDAAARLRDWWSARNR